MRVWRRPGSRCFAQPSVRPAPGDLIPIASARPWSRNSGVGPMPVSGQLLLGGARRDTLPPGRHTLHTDCPVCPHATRELPEPGRTL